MALYKRSPGGAWWVRFSAGSKTIRRSSGSRDRKFAVEYETALRARYLRQEKLGECVYTWKDAVDRYKRESVWRPATRKVNEFSLGFFERLNPIAVGAVTAVVVRAARDYVERSQRPSSANRIMAVFRGVLRSCVRWGWTSYAPPVPMAHVSQTEIAPLNGEQCAALLRELPLHLKQPMLFSVLTGLRMANARDLDWSQVDLEEGHVTVPASQYKTKRDQRFPLSTEAVALLSGLPNRSGRVFLYDGNPISGTFNTRAFRRARARAGLDKVRWHDLRHTFASWLATAGASDRVLQALGGWSSSRMVGRYAHLRPSDLRPYADAVGTKMGTALSDVRDSNSDETPRKQVVPSV